ncbi:2'-5' RNA ligase [Modicisalibacter muralis]|uniref:RNA 2',3'-cyclic phosphodiesterase n=1 Tax=Modicisalibacter muralis TaxID=119000 RepID=A0A1G9KPR3_9GAMM|nr:RNA 2',3'-cyclic phosphodiesterase [Halomonas muralis]SDL51524.1 2'-5' RNA ligase [Halomonas muralis]
MRLFFALWPDDALRGRLAALARDTQRDCGGRPTAPAKLHLTLAFIGDVAPESADALAALTATLPCPGGEWTLDRLGHFRRGGIAWAGSQAPSPPLEALNRQLCRALVSLDLATPSQRFLPHVTLLRQARRAPVRSLSPPLAWHYRRVALVHSRYADGRHDYVTLARTPLP